MTENKYMGLSALELKALKRVHKNSPETIVLVEAALDALKPKYTAGRLTNVEMDAVARLLDVLVTPPKEEDFMRLPSGADALITEVRAAIERFKIQVPVPELAPTPPAPDA